MSKKTKRKLLRMLCFITIAVSTIALGSVVGSMNTSAAEENVNTAIYTSCIDLRDAKKRTTGVLITQGEVVTIVDSDGYKDGWTLIRKKTGEEGYVYTKYISYESTYSTEPTSITSSKKNTAIYTSCIDLRDAKKRTTGVLITPGEIVTIVDSDGYKDGWTLVRKKTGEEGYVYTKYISYESTYSTGDTSSKSASVTLYNNPWGNSWFNIQLAAKNLNGYTLLPGETFSWRETMGPSSIEQGFKMAKGYAGKKVVSTEGGGVCFVSTTTMQAARKYGLEIIEKHDHGLPVKYAGRGNEAAVSYYGYQDLKIKNTTQSAVTFFISTDSTTGACMVRVEKKAHE